MPQPSTAAHRCRVGASKVPGLEQGQTCLLWSVRLGQRWGQRHQSCSSSSAKPSSCARVWAGRHRSTGTGRYCLAALLTCILRSFITSDRWQEMRLPLQMLIILRAVNNISGQLAHYLRGERPIRFALAGGGKKLKGRKPTGREMHGSAWLCLFCVSLGQREMLAASCLTGADVPLGTSSTWPSPLKSMEFDFLVPGLAFFV